MSAPETFHTPTLNICLDEARPMLSLSVDQIIGERAKKISDFEKCVEILGEEKIVIPTATYSWAIDLKPVGKLRNDGSSQKRLKGLNVFMGSLLNMPFLDLNDPQPVALGIGSYEGINGTGRLAVACEVRWPIPQIDDGDISKLATDVMVRAATELDYADMGSRAGKRRPSSGLVYAHIQRSRGVVLETNEMGSCSVGTDGSIYDPDEPTFELRSHNIYGVDQQIICVTGAIAIARAGELL